MPVQSHVRVQEFCRITGTEQMPDSGRDTNAERA